jgi:hypothetical protein
MDAFLDPDGMALIFMGAFHPKSHSKMTDVFMMMIENQEST